MSVKSNIQSMAKNVNKWADKNSPVILLGLGITGFIVTTVLAAKNAPKAAKVLKQAKAGLDDLKTELQEEIEAKASETEIKAIKDERRDLYLDTAKQLGKLYGPAVALGVSSTVCLIKSHNIEHRRLTAMAQAYQISEVARREYKDKVVELLGKKKEKDICDAIARDRVESNPADKESPVYNEGTDTLCFDALSGRYFRSNKTKLEQIENKLNKRLRNEMYISLNEFYAELDDPNMRPIGIGTDLGWNINNGDICFCFTSMLSQEGVPMLVLDYLVGPRYDYRSLL